ncbi:MAG: vWA domain-containing protein [Polaromonas sp.]
MDIDFDSHLRHALAARVAGFVATLRANGFKVGIDEDIGALAAASRLGMLDRDALRAGWRALLCGRGDEWRRFDDLFDSYWLPPNMKALVKSATSSGTGRATITAEDAPQSGRADAVFQTGEDDFGGDFGDTTREGASRSESVEQADFINLHNADQVRELEALVRDFTRRMRRLKLRRERVQAAGRRLDLRRTVRASLTYGGNPFHCMYRVPRRVRPRLVLLLDVSRSMSMYSFFYLRFARALAGVLSDMHCFIYHTHLTPVSEALSDPDPWRAQERLQLLSAGWAGGTRIGECLSEFNRNHAARLVHSRTVVLIASDGFDAGELGAVDAEMAKIARRARRVVWLNPLKSQPGYEPTARGMREAMPHVDLFASGHNLQELRALVPVLERMF